MRQLLGELALRAAHDRAVFVTAGDGRILAGEAQGARFGGRGVTALAGRALSDFYEPSRRSLLQQHLAAADRDGSHQVTGQFQGLDARAFAGVLSLERLSPAGPSGDWPRYGCVLIDQSGEERLAAAREDAASARAALVSASVERDTLQQILQSLGQALLVVDRDWRVLHVNEEAESLLRQPSSSLVGRDLRRKLGDVGTAALYEAIRQALLERVPVELEEFYPLSGTWYHVHAHPGEQGVTLMFRDVTDRREAQAGHASHAYDTRTGLPNRAMFEERAARAVAHARRFGQMISVLLLDVGAPGDDDDEGGADGELLLRAAAQALERRLRADDTLAQWDARRLAVLQEGLNRLDGGAGVAHDLVAALAGLPEVAGRRPPAVGIAVLGADGDSAEELLRAAATALAAAAAGGATHRYANAALHDQVDMRRRLEAELREGLAREQFRVHFQPEVDTRTGVIVGLEALLRWEHPGRGLLTAGEFLPVAGGSDVILPLGEWALREVCAQARAWRRAGVHGLRVAMNLSDAQLRAGALPSTILALLAEHDLPLESLEVEITEAQLLGERTAAESLCRRLGQAGIGVCVDDFGAGYGPIGALVGLSVRKVKIDPALVARLDTGGEGDGALDAILQLARVFQLDVVAKGVESERQLDYLSAHGCHVVQGYRVGRPAPAAALSAALLAGAGPPGTGGHGGRATG